MATTILEARGLRKNFGALVAVDDISVNIEPEEVIGLIGTNGAGKTTFVNMITGYLRPDAGTVLYHGRDFTAMKPRLVTRMGISRSFQIPQLYNTLTVRENMIVGLGIVWRNGRKSWLSRLPSHVPGYEHDIWETADILLDRFRLLAYRDRVAGVLPEGVRKLLDIAMALLPRPKVLLLDEPTSGVSSDEKFEIMDRVMSVALRDKVTILFVEHDMDIVSRYAKRVLAFAEGRLLADGSVATVLSNTDVLRLVIGGQATPGKAYAPLQTALQPQLG